MRVTIFIIALCLFSCTTNAKNKKRVLFIGNSYTYVNNMPQIVADLARSTGDTLIYDVEAPGGMMWAAHFKTNPPTLAKMQAGGWDYVVLQEQSQAPCFPPNLIQANVYDYARKLDSFFNKYNPCGETIFYMTWGRKNGDAGACPTYAPAWPHYCTYIGMDSVIRERYMTMANDNQAEVSPVSAVWRYLRVNHPSIDLYQSDESHPSEPGSYAAACAFYAAIFKKDPSLTTYNFTLSAGDAATIRAAAKKIAYDSLSYWHLGQHALAANFSHTTAASYLVNFTNSSTNATGYNWDFGDAQTSTQPAPSHTYSAPGNYNVRLIATKNTCSDTIYKSVNVSATGIINANRDNETFVIAPNPAHNVLSVYSGAFTISAYSIRITNNLGQTVAVQKTTSQREQKIDISALPAGHYVISVINNNKCVFRGSCTKN